MNAHRRMLLRARRPLFHGDIFRAAPIIRETCWMCHGSGAVTAHYADHSARESCTQCKGTGKLTREA